MTTTAQATLPLIDAFADTAAQPVLSYFEDMAAELEAPAPAPATVVLIGKCKRDGSLTRVERELFAGSSFPVGGYHVTCSTCGWTCDTSSVAKLSAIRCGAKCVNATGPACSCECGGRNHGGH